MQVNGPVALAKDEDFRLLNQLQMATEPSGGYRSCASQNSTIRDQASRLAAKCRNDNDGPRGSFSVLR